MPTPVHALVVLVSVLLLAKGAMWLVDAAIGLSKTLGVSELVIGLTVVAMGTSAPEFAVTLLAALDSRADVSVGNVVGSNIFNLGFILGGCALLRAIPTETTLVRRDGSIIIAATVLLLLLLGYDLQLDRHDGIVLLASLAGYLVYLFSQRRMVPGAADDLREAKEAGGRWKHRCAAAHPAAFAGVGHRRLSVADRLGKRDGPGLRAERLDHWRDDRRCRHVGAGVGHEHRERGAQTLRPQRGAT
jgi:Ca2+/Na+ antiporter